MNPNELIRRSLEDTTHVTSMEVGKALCESLEVELQDAVNRGKKHLSDESFAIVQILEGDRFHANAIKRLFFYSAFLPKPTFDQSVWVYNRRADTLTYMWSIPDRMTSAELASLVAVDKNWQRSADWCKMLYKDPMQIVRHRRKETGVDLETEKEFLYLHRQELARAVDDHVKSLAADTVN